MQHTITGTPFNVLNIQLDSHDRIVVEAGKTAWMEPSVHMQTSAMQHGGLWGAVKRSLGGGPWFWTSLQGPGRVAIAATLPGSIEHIDMQGGRGVLAHRSAFLAGTAEITVSVGFQQRWTAGLFGGDGFTLQHLRGTGSAWVQLGGSLTTCTLDVGESLYILPQHVALFDDSMAFQITRVKGIRNLLFGGEGVFFCRLTGPGTVWCQSMAMAQLASDLIPYLPQPTSATH